MTDRPRFQYSLRSLLVVVTAAAVVMAVLKMLGGTRSAILISVSTYGLFLMGLYLFGRRWPRTLTVCLAITIIAPMAMHVFLAFDPTNAIVARILLFGGYSFLSVTIVVLMLAAICGWAAYIFHHCRQRSESDDTPSPLDHPFAEYLRLAAILWASPYTLLGFLLGLLGLCTGGKVRRRARVIEFYGGSVKWLLQKFFGGQGAMAFTLGHTVLGQTEAALDITRQHELVHVRQFERWGLFMGPAYLGCSLVLWLTGRRAYRDNPFERQAFQQASEEA
jgi:hypothetical protein